MYVCPYIYITNIHEYKDHIVAHHTDVSLVLLYFGKNTNDDFRQVTSQRHTSLHIGEMSPVENHLSYFYYFMKNF